MSGGMKSHTMNVQLTGKNILTLDELEFYELAQLAGVNMEPTIFKIILDLLRLNVSPQAVLQMLKTMCSGKIKQKTSSVTDGENIPQQSRQRMSSKTRHPSGSSSLASRRTDHKR